MEKIVYLFKGDPRKIIDQKVSVIFLKYDNFNAKKGVLVDFKTKRGNRSYSILDKSIKVKISNVLDIRLSDIRKSDLISAGYSDYESDIFIERYCEKHSVGINHPIKKAFVIYKNPKKQITETSKILF